MLRLRQACVLGFVSLVFLGGPEPAEALASYAESAVDVAGSTGAAAVALGVPDYAFTNDVGLGFGGTSADVFEVGESVVLGFPAPLRDVAGQHDLILSAYVGGLGEIDNATVQVEVSSDGTVFELAGVFDTEEARDRPQDRQENDFDGVKHFFVDFAGADDVTHVRLTNLAGTSEGLRLDAVEGLHPFVDSTHAFEIRFERYRPDFNQRFRVHIKNIADGGGVPIREFRIDRPTSFPSTLEDTDDSLLGLDGEFVCVENCIPDNGPLIDYTRMVWSADGVNEAPAGVGLEPGREAVNARDRNFDIDTQGTTYLSGFSFTVIWADGVSHVFDYDADVLIEEGNLYQKYLYFTGAPAESGPRPTDYYEFLGRSVVTFSDPASVGDGHEPGVGGRLEPTSQNFVEDGMHVEAFWVPNDQSSFVSGHFHELSDGFETSHGFESSPGLGPDRQGIYIERVDGGTFDFESLDYQVAGTLTSATILVSTSYDPALPIGGQFTEYAVSLAPGFETLDLQGFEGVSQVFVLPELSEDSAEQVRWDEFVLRTDDPVTISPSADAGADIELTDDDDDGLEVAGLDGAASSDPDGMIVSWVWREGGTLLGTGMLLDQGFSVGRHDVELEVTDDDGNRSVDVLSVQINPPGGLPFADAGPSVVVLGAGGGSALVTLDGSGSFDSDGFIVSWDWSEGGVPLGSGETLGVALTVGVHVIDLAVQDDGGNLAFDAVTVTVNPLGGVPPSADAGPDVAVTDLDTDGSESVLLDGSGSSDSDGFIVDWSWSEAGVPLGSGETFAVMFPVGVHSVDLVVQDDQGNVDVDTIVITVESGIVIQPAGYVAHETSGNGSNGTVHDLGVSTLPILAGDLLLAHVCSDGGGGAAIACPAGWTQLEHSSHPSGRVLGALCYKQADFGDEGATSYQVMTTAPQQTMSAVILIEHQDPVTPIDLSAVMRTETDTSPLSPAFQSSPLPSSRVLRFFCADGGRVTAGVGFPTGMAQDLFVEESGDGGSGPVSGGAAVDGVGVVGGAEWTNALSSSEESVNFSVALAGRVSQLSADAGSDATLIDGDEDGTESVLLDGSGSSDFGGSIVRWSWSEAGTPLGDGETLAVVFALGTHDVDLEVEDDDGNLASDSVLITVNAGGLVPPGADAGTDVELIDVDDDGSEAVTLDGSGSADSDGFIVSWEWSEAGVPLGSGETLAASFAVGVHTVDLLVTDDDGNTASDSVGVTVLAGGLPPVADAGADVTVSDANEDGSETVLLNGSSSFDADGAVVSWAWSVAGVPVATGPLPSIVLAVGTHDVDLLVTDDDGLTGSDAVRVVVNPGGDVVPPSYIAHQTSEEVSNTTTHTLAVDTLPIQAGDLLIAHLCVDGGGGTTVSCPVGWAEVENAAHQAGAVLGAVCQRQADASDESLLSVEFTSSVGQHSQSGVILLSGQDAVAPIEASAQRVAGADPSPDSPAFAAAPAPSSMVLRFMCANAGQVTEGVGFPSGMNDELWLLQSAAGFSGPVAGGAAIDANGAGGSVEWTDALASSQQAVGFSVAIAGGAGVPIADAGLDVAVVDDDESGSEDILLDGSGSFDPNGSIVAWSWTAGRLPLGVGETLLASFGVGIHAVELEVEDDEGNLATNGVTVTILAGGTVPPLADAGVDVAIADIDDDGFETVVLDGSGSSDLDGFVVQWDWSEGGSPLGSAELLPVSFAVGSHLVDLLVTDDDGNTDSHSIVVDVLAGGGPQYQAHETSEETSNVTTHTLGVASLPIQSGDLLIAHVCVDGGGGTTISCPPGWAEVENRAHQSGGVAGALCSRVADVSDESQTSYAFASSVGQQSQSGVILLSGQDAIAPIEASVSRTENDTSPSSPDFPVAPASNSLVLRFTCANTGQVTEGSGFPAGMSLDLWLLESADGGSGPVSGGAAVEGLGTGGESEWTGMLATGQQSVNFSLSVRASP